MPELTMLNLEKNKLKVIAQGAFSRLFSVRTINLNQNQLENFSVSHELPALECLILSFNQITQ